jgi:hypothetical protein
VRIVLFSVWAVLDVLGFALTVQLWMRGRGS